MRRPTLIAEESLERVVTICEALRAFGSPAGLGTDAHDLGSLRDERKTHPLDELAPRHLAVVLGPQGHRAEEREQRIGDAPQDHDDERAVRVARRHGLVILGEDGIERVVDVVLDCPVRPHGDEPLVRTQSIRREAADGMTCLDELGLTGLAHPGVDAHERANRRPEQRALALSHRHQPHGAHDGLRVAVHVDGESRDGLVDEQLRDELQLVMPLVLQAEEVVLPSSTTSRAFSALAAPAS